MSAPYMPLFCGDYLKDTGDLTPEEHGAYLLILMYTWAQGGQPLPDDDARMASRLRLSKDRWAKRVKPVIARYFDLSAGTWRNERLEAEWAKAQDKIAARTEAGRKGGRPRKNPPGNPPNHSGPSREHFGANGADKPLKNNETAKANGFGLFKQTESNHNQTPDSVEESCGGVDSNPVRAGARDAPPHDPASNVVSLKEARPLKPCDAGWTLPPDWEAWALDQGHGDCQIAERRFRRYWADRRDKCLRLSLVQLREEWEVWILGNLKWDREHGYGRNDDQGERLRHGLALAFSDLMDPGPADTGGSGRDVTRRHR